MKTKKFEGFAQLDGVEVQDVAFTFSQNADSNQLDPDDGQSIDVFTDDNGAGPYVVFSTERWALDADEIDKFAALLKQVVALAERGE